MAIGSVKLTGTPQQYSNPKVTVDAFGAGVGRALKGLATSFEDYDKSLEAIQLAQQEEETRRSRFDATMAATRLNGAWNRDAIDAINNAPESGQGLTNSFEEHLNSTREAFLAAIPDEKVRQEMAAQTEDWVQKHTTQMFLQEFTQRQNFEAKSVDEATNIILKGVHKGDIAPDDAMTMLDRALDLTNLPDTLKEEVRTNNRRSFLRTAFGRQVEKSLAIDQNFSDSLARFIYSAPPDIQAQVGIISGDRSPAHQQELYDRAIATHGRADLPGHQVAKPGHSQHELGRAADLSFANPEAKQWVHDHAEEAGFTFPVPGEDWHIEAIGGRNAPTIPDVWNDPQYAELSYEDKLQLDKQAGDIVTARQTAIAAQQQDTATQLRNMIAASGLDAKNAIESAISLNQLPPTAIAEFIRERDKLQVRDDAQLAVGAALTTGAPIANTPENKQAIGDYFVQSGVLEGLRNLDPGAAERAAQAVAGSGLFPDNLSNFIQGMANSAQPQQQVYALDLLATMMNKNDRLAGVLPKGMVEDAVNWSFATRYSPVNEKQMALDKFNESTSPEGLARIEAATAIARKELSNIPESVIANAMDDWTPLDQADLPKATAQRDLFFSDFNRLYTLGRSRGLSKDDAISAAAKLMSINWVKETVGGGNVLMAGGPSSPGAGYINPNNPNAFHSPEEIDEVLRQELGYPDDRSFNVLPDAPVIGQPTSFAIWTENDFGELVPEKTPDGEVRHFRPAPTPEMLELRQAEAITINLQAKEQTTQREIVDLMQEQANIVGNMSVDSSQDPRLPAISARIKQLEDSLPAMRKAMNVATLIRQRDQTMKDLAHPKGSTDPGYLQLLENDLARLNKELAEAKGEIPPRVGSTAPVLGMSGAGAPLKITITDSQGN